MDEWSRFHSIGLGQAQRDEDRTIKRNIKKLSMKHLKKQKSTEKECRIMLFWLLFVGVMICGMNTAWCVSDDGCVG